MKKLKSLISGALTLLAFLVCGTAHAQIPVTDVAELAQAVVEVEQLVSQLEVMKQQYSTLTSSYSTLTAQYAAITGNHSYGTILNSSSLHSYLPDSWSSVYSNIESGNLSSLASSMKTILSDEGLTSAATTGQQRYYNVLASNKSMQMAAYDANISRLNNIESLMEQANETTDESAKADLMNRMHAEEAMVQNENTRLSMMSQLQQSELKLSEQQRENEFKSYFLGTSD
jgi:type IV secretion system protein VirB5